MCPFLGQAAVPRVLPCGLPLPRTLHAGYASGVPMPCAVWHLRLIDRLGACFAFIGGTGRCGHAGRRRQRDGDICRSFQTATDDLHDGVGKRFNQVWSSEKGGPQR